MLWGFLAVFSQLMTALGQRDFILLFTAAGILSFWCAVPKLAKTEAGNAPFDTPNVFLIFGSITYFIIMLNQLRF